eukprot:5242736-Amphidinium_carterae.2
MTHSLLARRLLRVLLVGTTMLLPCPMVPQLSLLPLRSLLLVSTHSYLISMEAHTCPPSFQASGDAHHVETQRMPL